MNALPPVLLLGGGEVLKIGPLSIFDFGCVIFDFGWRITDIRNQKSEIEGPLSIKSIFKRFCCLNLCFLIFRYILVTSENAK